MRPGLKIALGFTGALIVLVVLFGLLGLGFGWFHKAVDTVSPQNVQKQYDLVIRDWNALTTAADNACSAGSATSDPNSPTFVESPAQAYIGTYRNIRQDYNAAWQNIFDAKLVGPPGYPHNVPNFRESIGSHPDFCAVSAQLQALQNQ